MQKLIPCLWLDDQAEQAAEFYTSIFPSARVRTVTRYGEATRNPSGKPPGSVMTMEIELEGQRFVLLNGGPQFKFSEAISFMVRCKDQEEIDHYWTKLSEGGQPGPCGWLKDRFGLSWQIVPKRLKKLLQHESAERRERVMAALLSMGKLDLAALERAFKGS